MYILQVPAARAGVVHVISSAVIVTSSQAVVPIRTALPSSKPTPEMVKAAPPAGETELGEKLVIERAT